MKEKVFKAGTVLKINLLTSWPGCSAEDEITLSHDMTETELRSMLWDMAVEHAAPDYDFEVIS